MGQPLGGARRVGQVLLVQHFERRLATREFGQHRVGAGTRQARVQQLDNHVNLPDALANGFARQVHMPGKPLYRHVLILFA